MIQILILKIILIIGGHDPTGGAGITADIETANHFNCHPLSILTCTTIQDTSGVIKINNMPKDYIYKCFDKLIKEFKVNAIKINLEVSGHLIVINNVIRIVIAIAVKPRRSAINYNYPIKYFI